MFLAIVSYFPYFFPKRYLKYTVSRRKKLRYLTNNSHASFWVDFSKTPLSLLDANISRTCQEGRSKKISTNNLVLQV